MNNIIIAPKAPNWNNIDNHPLPLSNRPLWSTPLYQAVANPLPIRGDSFNLSNPSPKWAEREPYFSPFPPSNLFCIWVECSRYTGIDIVARNPITNKYNIIFFTFLALYTMYNTMVITDAKRAVREAATTVTLIDSNKIDNTIHLKHLFCNWNRHHNKITLANPAIGANHIGW